MQLPYGPSNHTLSCIGCYSTYPGFAVVSLLVKKRCVLLAKLLLLVWCLKSRTLSVCATQGSSAACWLDPPAASDAGMLLPDEALLVECSWPLLLLVPMARLVLEAKGAAAGMNLRAGSSE